MSSSTQFLYQFTSADILNTSLVDVHTGAAIYEIVTRSDHPDAFSQEMKLLSRSDGTSAAGSSRGIDTTDTPKRRTLIYDSTGVVLCDIAWTGRIPDITIGDENIGPLKQLFGSSGVPFQHDVLIIPSRFNHEWVWTATADSLVLYDYGTQTRRGAFYHNVVRFASKDHFINARIPGLGHNYLSLPDHNTISPAEFIVSFIMLEIVRRGRFSLTPYSFERPKYWQLEEARDLIMRRMRTRRRTI